MNELIKLRRTELATLSNQAKSLYAAIEAAGEKATQEDRNKFAELVDSGKTKRKALVAEYEDQLANPYIAAERGYVDSVIPPSLTRTYVVRALRALRTKRQTLPAKKHGNIPL